MNTTAVTKDAAAAPGVAAAALDEHTREMIEWHFSPDTGCPYWLDWAAAQKDFDPIHDVRTFADITKFPHFDEEVLRFEDPYRFVPQPYRSRPFNIFETGGTTGMPKQRIGWDDYKIDYEEFGNRYGDDVFPSGADWLMIGPTGPRRLRLAIEHLANYKGGSCYFIDLDPRWVKRLIADGELKQARAYQNHVIDQAVTLLRHRKVGCLFTTPKLLESLGERLSIPGAGIKGAFCGGTTMTPQFTRFICEEVLEGQTTFVPTYGNTLMGLACSKPTFAQEGYSICYYAPQPRAVLRVVNPDDTAQTVDYDAWGRVELTTMTREFFMPRMLERDEAIRRRPWGEFPWDGVAEVRPFGASKTKIVEGVY